MSNTPPLNALRVFESVARLKSFSKAAEELHVSQSAVSRQISLLEGYLEVQFFHRDRTGIRLTELGQQYFEGIQPAFERIVAGAKLRFPIAGGPHRMGSGVLSADLSASRVVGWAEQ